jgi:hypothetical protein
MVEITFGFAAQEEDEVPVCGTDERLDMVVTEVVG